MLDALLIWLGALGISLLFRWVFTLDNATFRGWRDAILVLLIFVLVWGYFTLFEAFNGGRTPGKQALGIRVVMDTGRSVTPGAAVIRNLVRILDCYFPLLPVLPALVMMFVQKSNKRLGDLAAGTIVVRDKPTAWTIGAAAAREKEAEAIETGPPDLTEEEFRLLDRFLNRQNELAPEVLNRIAGNLAQRFEARILRQIG